MNRALHHFRKQVLRRTLFSARSLADAFRQLGFVQADPIRSPARAQDLILRQRVRGYEAGDLEQAYPQLPLEEAFLFAYGFASKELWGWMHPKPTHELSAEQQQVLKLLRTGGPMHPRDLEAHLGSSNTRNAWGGTSRTSKVILERLHDRGLIRVARRESGIRVYEFIAPPAQAASAAERYQELLLASLQAMGASSRGFLIKELGYHGYLAGNRSARIALLDQLIDQGRIRVDHIEQMEYLSLPDGKEGRLNPDRLRILAPFDPVVRDRTRFEQFWGWAYRFEAYTPAAKRKMGYYAMPLLWREEVIGWANASVQQGTLSCRLGLLKPAAEDPAFQAAAEQEIESMTRFLGLPSGHWELYMEAT